jgi:hypothetical protein
LACSKIEQEAEQGIASNQERFEIADNAIDQIKKLFCRLKNQITFRDLRLGERYIKAELKILVRMSFVGRSGDICDFIANYESHESMVAQPHSLASSKIDSPLVHDCCDGQQQAVFVDYVESMEQPKILIKSLVRLYRTQDFFRANRHSLYFSSAKRRCVLLGTFADREKSVSVRLTPASFDELPSKMVQSTSEIVNGITENESNIGRNGLDLSDEKRRMVNCGYRVWLGSDSIGIRVEKGLNADIKVTDMLFGPFNLEPDGTGLVHND